MKARAPGKLVLSGAYAVLSGAPAIVTAVDRYVLADSGRPAERTTPEVAAALPSENAPWFDASPLRQGPYKLGLGSSAAILVASLAAVELERGAVGDAELGQRVLERALGAHRLAQGGGSGVDVAASALGGTLRYVVGQPLPEAQPLSVPEGLVVEAWWSGQPASTSELLQKVAELRALLPDVHRGLIEAQAGAAEQTAVAFQQGALRDFLTGINLQFGVLSALGTLAQAPIVTPEAERLGKQARAEGAAALPAGAGGGDILMFFGGSPSTKRFRRIAVECRHQLLDLRIGARGVHAVG